PRSLCDVKWVIPRYVENLGRSAHDQRIAAQHDQGLPGEVVVVRSFVLVKAPPLLSVEPEGVPSGSYPGVASSRGLLEFLVPYTGDSRARKLASVEIPLPAGYNLDAPVGQVSITVGQMLAQRPLGLRLGQGLRDEPEAELPALQASLEIGDQRLQQLLLRLIEVTAMGPPRHVAQDTEPVLPHLCA